MVKANLIGLTHGKTGLPVEGCIPQPNWHESGRY